MVFAISLFFSILYGTNTRGIKIERFSHMDLKETSLAGIIKQRIREQGPISFHDFMEMSLYYPGLGYYTSGSEKIGKNGDYYTSPWLSTVLGEMLARQLEEMWHILDKKDFTIVEYGGGNGTLCRQILHGLKQNNELYDKLHYCIIEKRGRIAENDKIMVPGKLSWHESIHDISPMNGCILSNELLDNFAVSPVVMQDELMEVYVDYQDGFTEVLRPATDRLKDYLQQLRVSLPKGFRTEINLQAIDWLRDIAGVLQKGFVLTIDYGYPSSDLYSASRRQGTLLCYHKHHISFCPYENVGAQDITTHVNFSALNHWGVKNGLQYRGFTNQASFLLGLGLTQHLNKIEKEQKDNSINFSQQAVMLHSFLNDMGKKFKVLIQDKGLQKPRLSGLQFAQSFI